ncbi:flagellar hook capping FlgD N-terminal domain-containing protein [Sphingomonas sp. 1P06PA]|uniref:flagellar hook assembly protein FlgD n=1 Tax=Sphingomonas sp. 1P06PA TaxID=554121 RepID=UPI0039A5B3F7
MTTVSNSSDALALPATSVTKNEGLDQAAFLKLMTTQLKTQDPFDPVDNTQMVAQMAQFSSVAGIAEMNASLKAIAASVADSRVGDAASWIGRAALVPSDITMADADGGFAGELTLPAAASDVSLSLVDANGVVVHSEALGAQPAGSLAFRWDGKAADGSQVAGPLRVVTSAKDAAGAAVTPTVATWAAVTGVQSPAGGASARLVTPIGTFAPADAQRLG